MPAAGRLRCRHRSWSREGTTGHCRGTQLHSLCLYISTSLHLYLLIHNVMMVLTCPDQSQATMKLFLWKPWKLEI